MTKKSQPKDTGPQKAHSNGNSSRKRVSSHKPTGSQTHQPAVDQLPGYDAFAAFAQSVARGEVLVPPLLLTKHDRRGHIRRTLIEDHQFRLHNRPDAVQAKFETMAQSPFRFFRGTALLYYRDYAGTDASMPIVLCLGDVHPKNFGVMPSADGTPVFGPNDFDEAHFAPFSYDVKRGAVGFDLAAREEGLKKKHRCRVIESYAKGYVDALEDSANENHTSDSSMRIDNSPPMIRELLEASIRDRGNWLSKMIDLERGEFRPTDEIVPFSSRVEEFQKIVNDYRKQNDLGEVTRFTDFKVKDVALKKGSGTASLGLDRYFVLIDGPSDECRDDIVLEMKQARRSAMVGVAPASTLVSEDDAERVVTAESVHVAGGDPYYGTATIEGSRFLVRERSPLKNSFDPEDFSLDDWVDYACVCGKALAIAHARSDSETGIQKGKAEQEILKAIDTKTFLFDIIDFATAASKQIRRDWKVFCKDFERGIFQA